MIYLKKNPVSEIPPEVLPDFMNFPARLGISVPKRKFKRAVDRNRIKRQVRESYRKLKGDLLYPFLLDRKLGVDILLIYTHGEILETKIIHLKIQSIIYKFKNEFKEGLE